MQKKEIPQWVEEIVQTEWKLFQQVQNKEGRAPCQDDQETFMIMRRSQFGAWNEQMLASYQQDLAQAMQQGRNLVAEKYAHMMKHTAPKEYAELAHLLPDIAPKTEERIDRIVQLQVQQNERVAEEFPLLAQTGRSTHSSDDSASDTSFETYLFGELCTYSADTLRLYEQHINDLTQKGESLGRQVLQNTVHAYGLGSLEESEQMLRSKREEQ